MVAQLLSNTIYSRCQGFFLRSIAGSRRLLGRDNYDSNGQASLPAKRAIARTTGNPPFAPLSLKGGWGDLEVYLISTIKIKKGDMA
jgi:hypothetical protein